MKQITKKIKSSESTISMYLGIAVVVIVGVLLFKYFKGTSVQDKITSGEKTEITETTGTPSLTPVGESVPLPAKYVVQKGDNLWNISIRFFGFGYNWTDISRENNMKNPNQLLVGQKLTIPNVPAKKPLVEVAKIQTPKASEQITVNPITENTYTIVKGDNLWNISVRAYQDGFKWPEIAEVNKIANPSMIHPGNILTIPR